MPNAKPSGLDRVYIAPEGTPGTPGDAAPDAAWIDLGEIFGWNNPNPTVTSRNTTMNRPKFANAVHDGSFELVDMAGYDSVAALEAVDAPVLIAVRKADATFRILKNQRVSIRPSGANGSGQLQTAMVRHYGAKRNVRDLQTADTAPAGA